MTKPRKLTPQLLFYILMSGTILSFFISAIATKGASFDLLFFQVKTDTYADFFNHIFYVGYNWNPYDLSYNACFPPMAYLFYGLLSAFIPQKYLVSGTAVRASQNGQVIFFICLILIIFAYIIIVERVKKGTRKEVLFFVFILFLSAPYLYVFERGNIIFPVMLLVLLFVFFRKSDNKVIRELSYISLALAFSFKLYPAIFGLILLRDKRYYAAARTSLYGVGLLFLPSLAFGGLDSLLAMKANLQILSNSAIYSVYTYHILPETLTYVILALGFLSSLFLKDAWKFYAVISCLAIMIPTWSASYTVIFMTIPLIVFMNQKDQKKLDYSYSILLSLMFMPIPFHELIHMISLWILFFLIMAEGLHDFLQQPRFSKKIHAA